MAATSDQIEAALLAPWQSIANGGTGEWTGTDAALVAFDNADFDPPNDNSTPWMEAEASSGRQDALDVGVATYTGMPTLTVSANVEVGRGKSIARQLLDAAVAMYAGKILTAGTSSLHAYSISPPIETIGKSGWYRLSQQISFRSI